MARIAAFRLSLVVLLVVSTTLAQEKAERAIKGWGTVVDPDGDCQVAEEEGKVTILIPGTHHNLNPLPIFNNISAPRVLTEIEGDFLAQVKVNPFVRPAANTSSNGRNSYVGGGLLVWQDGQNFIRLMRAARGDDNTLFLSLEMFQDGQMVASQYGTLEDEPQYFRLERFDDEFSFSVSKNGRAWFRVPVANIKLNKKLQVGVAAVNSTIKATSTQFEEFKLLVGK